MTRDVAAGAGVLAVIVAFAVWSVFAGATMWRQNRADDRLFGECVEQAGFAEHFAAAVCGRPLVEMRAPLTGANLPDD